ncbi:MAG: 23S rRNA pseudouridine(1911/1915/1917) synthase RluD [Gammaproteobacteria bacterium]|nr:23S rRNA pseudouridine(1911/1915/1917) synthase RluD [Gammaproteobacteria bacterium]
MSLRVRARAPRAASVSGAITEHHRVELPAAVEGLRLDQALARVLSQYSRNLIKQWMDAGQVTRHGAVLKPRTTARGGDIIEVIATLDATGELAPQAVDFSLAHVDEHVIVIDKPVGLVVHPGAGNPDHTLVNGLLARFPELAALPRAGLVHRIDKDTSGLLVAARTPQAFQSLVRALARRDIHRHYLAVVNGVMVAGGTIEAAIARDPQQRTRMRVMPGGREAVTHYRVAERYRAHTLLEVELETGRTHQIRVHLSWRGYPLVGDSRYGGRPHLPPGATEDLRATLQHFPRQALHAWRLAFTHPVDNTELEFESAPPADFEHLLEVLQADVEAHGQRDA